VVITSGSAESNSTGIPPARLDEDVTIATAAHGNAAVTSLCLQALFRSAVGDYELLLIDDCSPDGDHMRALYGSARAQHANTKIFSFSENLEYTGSVDAVLSHARGQWVFFISNDIFVTPAYLQGLLEAARSNPRLGILRGSSNFVDNGGLATHNVPVSSPLKSLEDLLGFSAEQRRIHRHEAAPDPFLVGDAFLVRREVIARIGTFDPRFYGYFGDPDYGVRARIAGFELAVVRGAFAFHSQDANLTWLPEAQRQEKRQRRWARVYENWARFKWKYGMPVSLPYSAVKDIPWAQLASLPFDPQRDYAPPRDYSRFLV
jgi:GT2 family glycosyltransferase